MHTTTLQTILTAYIYNIYIYMAFPTNELNVPRQVINLLEVEFKDITRNDVYLMKDMSMFTCKLLISRSTLVNFKGPS